MSKHILVLALLVLIRGYFVSQTISTTASSTISNYYQDVSACSCNLAPSFCDNFCCCDILCSSSQIQSWTSSSLCLATSSSLEAFCSQLSQTGFTSFSDLACVQTSNRGTIGRYYEYPDVSNLAITTTSMFAAQTINLKKLSELGAANSAAYTVGNLNVKIKSSAGPITNLLLLGPSQGACTYSTTPLNISKSTSCTLSLSAASCTTANSYLPSSFNVCLDGSCSSLSSSYSAPTATLDSTNSTCSNVISGAQLSYQIGWSNGEYILSNVNLVFSTSSVTLSGKVSVSRSISGTANTTSSNGNPGYQSSSFISIFNNGASFNLKTIRGSDGSCYSTTNNTSASTISLNFAQPYMQSCTSTSPCSTSLYLDSLASMSMTIKQYATGSSQAIPVVITNSSTCAFQSVVLSILYSSDGWVLDSQQYIVGASLSGRNTNPAGNNRYLKVEWIYVDPSSVSRPPSNNFYKYFSYLWTPISSQFGLS